MSYDRSPRPDCSMTMGIRPRPWVSSALMVGNFAPKTWLYFSLNAVGAWLVVNKTSQAPTGMSWRSGLRLAHQLVEGDALLDHLRLGQDEVRDVVFDHDGFHLGQ